MGLLEKLGKIKGEFNKYKEESKKKQLTKRIELKKSLKEEIELTKLQTKVAQEKEKLSRFQSSETKNDWFPEQKKKNFGGFEKKW